MHALTPRLLVGLLSLLLLTAGCEPGELTLPELPLNPDDWRTEIDDRTAPQDKAPVGPCEGICSCEDSCGQAPADKSCFCDAFCLEVGDCCEDFDAVCDGARTDDDQVPDDGDDGPPTGGDDTPGPPDLDPGDDDGDGDGGWGEDDDDGGSDGPCEGTCSCEGVCGDAPGDESCFCDDECVEYGDCCPDFESLCDGGGGWDDGGDEDDWGGDGDEADGVPCEGTCSCEDVCGEAPDDESCFCDDVCSEYGDCCPDFASLCEGEGGDGGWGDDATGDDGGDGPGDSDDATAVGSPFTVGPVPASMSAFQPFFTKHVSVFGVNIFGRATVPDGKLLYAANVMAEYLDNDEDGVADDPAVVAAMVEQPGGSSLVMFANGWDLESSGIFESSLPDIYPSQDLHASETFPEGSSAAAGFDATLEEVLHLITSQGYAQAYPSVFGEEDSTLTDAMDLARGGKFISVPASYPGAAWYHYDDTTCDYRCMATEYIYWGLTSLLGAQDYPGRCEEIAVEWELCTPAAFTGGDPTLHGLLTDPAYTLPTVLPDGVYAPGG